ncbi:MAG TPA: hypothetical protein VLK23_16020 [Thermodesulfobacteriota bacterium]|nr:hypothetical protein [Thermodesulfobacteriota bacterium]
MDNLKPKRIVLSVLVIAICVIFGCAQRSVQSQGGTKPEGSPITIKGKIDFMKNLGGYFVLGEVPAREYIIVNENPKVLEELYKSGRIVTIEGRIVRAAEYLFIEKIDGKTYLGKMEPAK